MKKITKILSLLLVCIVFLSACGNKDEAKKPDYKPFMIKATEDFVKDQFGASDVKVSNKDYVAIHTDEVLKTVDGKTYDKSIVGTGKITIDNEEYKYQLIVNVDNLEDPKDYLVLNFETIDKTSQYDYDILED